MKWILLLFVLLTANYCFAKQSIMHSLYLADRPDFDGDDELSMIGEFGFLVANGNTNASTITAKINTSQELTSWSYQIIGSALYKQKFSDYATFRQFVSTETDQEFYKTKSETSLSTKLHGALTMKLSFIMNLDTSVAPETEELDTEVAVTLVYQFF